LPKNKKNKILLNIVPKIIWENMQVFDTLQAYEQFIKEKKRQQVLVGFVPTMGALHQGHLELIRHAKQGCQLVVCSIFVNPTQFNNSDDLAKYPRTPAQDLALLKAAGCDVVFMPTVEQIYPDKNPTATLSLHFGHLETVLEGAFRPGHFAGVGLVVAKLFHIIQPDIAFFGQKDLQQCAVIRTLVQQLHFPIQLKICPTVRDTNGLALSSRNQRLDTNGLQLATNLYKCLQVAQQQYQINQDPAAAVFAAKQWIAQFDQIQLEYLEIIDPEQFIILQKGTKHLQYAVCIAAYIQNVRLIDNLLS